jgi:hypothetical protein
MTCTACCDRSGSTHAVVRTWCCLQTLVMRHSAGAGARAKARATSAAWLTAALDCVLCSVALKEEMFVRCMNMQSTSAACMRKWCRPPVVFPLPAAPLCHQASVVHFTAVVAVAARWLILNTFPSVACCAVPDARSAVFDCAADMNCVREFAEVLAYNRTIIGRAEVLAEFRGCLPHVHITRDAAPKPPMAMANRWQMPAQMPSDEYSQTAVDVRSFSCTPNWLSTYAYPSLFTPYSHFVLIEGRNNNGLATAVCM